MKMDVDSTQPEQQNQRYLESGFIDQLKYKKLGNAWIEGGLFQVNLLTIFLLNAIEKIDRWRLSTENEEGGKFDDIIFEQPDGAVLVQAKHKKNEWKKITYEDLVSTNSKKDDFSLPKYFFSFQEVKHKFKVVNVVICTNAYIEIAEGVVNEPLNEKSMLYFEGVGEVSYTFHDQIIPGLEENIRTYHRKNLQAKSISDKVISKESIKDFLNHLQFIAGYPSVESLNQIIQKMISQSKFFSHLDCKVAHKFVHDKIMEWFKQKNGIYLNQHNSQAIFCEITSKRYCQILEEFKIFFEDGSPFADCNKKILHLITPGECLLYVMRVYRALSTESALFVNPDDDIAVQNGIIDYFEESHYTYLVLVCSKTSKEEVKGICRKIYRMLDRNDKKRLILIGAAQNEMAEQLKSLNVNIYEQIDQNISLANVAKHTQKKFLEKTVAFQGYDLSLRELLSKEDLIQIVNSEMLAKLARNEKIEVGTNVKLLLDDSYIPRSFNRNEQYVPEEDMCLLDENYGEKVILISDCAGMGKSTVLAHMAVNIKKSNPSLWVIRIDINSYAKILYEIDKKGLNSNRINRIIELLDSQNDTRFKSDFERKLFLVPGKVVMMIDGLDEISPNYTDIILKLLVEIKTKPNFVKIFVTTRPHVCDALEHSLKVKSFTLNPFSKENQIDFLCKYWRNHIDIERKDMENKCYIYAEAVVTKMSVWVNEDASDPFAGIPLQTRMLAEIFQEKIVFQYEELEQWEGCKEFLNSKHNVPQLPGKINLIKLYKMFIDRKCDIFVKTNSSGSIVAEKAIQEVFERCYNCHYGLAWEIFFASYGKLLDCYEINTEHLEDVIRIGIVQRINGRFVFIHRTFAEYFVAEYLLKKIKNEHQDKNFQKSFLRYILYKYEFSVIRAFFDSFFQKELDTFPRRLFNAYRFSILSSCFVSVPCIYRGAGACFLHTLSAEGCTNILRFLFKCLDFNDNRNPLYRWVTKLTIKLLDVDREGSLGRTALQHAAAHGRLDIVELLLNKGTNVNHTDEMGNTPLHEVVWARSLDIENFIRQGKNYVNSKFENSLDIVKLLTRNGASVNIKDTSGYTPLNIAVINGNNEVAKFLVEEGADVNAKIAGGYTALHIAANNENIDMVTFLVEKAADVNISSKHGCTALHIAACNRSMKIAQFLVKRGAHINETYTMRDIAAHDKNFETINFLQERWFQLLRYSDV